MTPEELKEIRNTLDLDQASFAAMLGYKNRREYISRLENGKHHIPITIEILARILRDIPEARLVAFNSAQI